MNNSKSRKVGKINKKDRISCMPDSILCHILSFLSTEDAVRTSILSSRWKLVWASLPNLMFNDKLCYRRDGTSDNGALTRFENFVDRMLLSNSVSISKFSLHCQKKPRYLSRLKFWVALAIMRNVHEIEVNLPVDDPFEEGYEPVELPDCIYNSETLEILKLETDFVFKSPSSGICFPRVKKFHVEIYKPNMPDFSICPVLEDLSIDYSLNFDWDADISISSQTLKRLNLMIGGPIVFANEHQATIEAPKLEHLHVNDGTLVSYLVYELHSLCDARLDIDYSRVRSDPVRADHALQLLKKLTNLKSLYLSCGTIYALGEAYRHLYDAHQYFLPTFSNLSFLEVRIREYGWWILPIIFNCSPNLESFVLIMDVNGPEYYVEAGWIEPQFVPYCLQFNVKKIEILYGDDDPLEPVKYLLKIVEFWIK
ncbi:LOW QUALITY PROTEIN: F-box/LRR-repeat protein At4g14103 [Citrus clementina]|uniref:LOW QUALITY PROTEIN: F-box/LRR-repeat protein At4g14103 n=1 Tax=Citrus clementina TaxID=85681 RepID=UPI000CED465D|nr:LOW QUALITY PROTEIN: F-box/LRR-repeat protein At4g14103 [Citrus x clementina]